MKFNVYLLFVMQVKHTSRQSGCLSGPPAASSLPREQVRNHMCWSIYQEMAQELQTATDDYSTASYTTPYYSYLVKRLPIESNSNKGHPTQ